MYDDDEKFFINIFNFLLLQNKRLGTHAGMADMQEIYPPPKVGLRPRRLRLVWKSRSLATHKIMSNSACMLFTVWWKLVQYNITNF